MIPFPSLGGSEPKADRRSRADRLRAALPSAALLLTVLLILLFVLAEAANAQARTADTVLSAEIEGMRRNQEELGYSSAVIAGDLIFLSGIVVGMRQGDTDMAGAYDRVYRLIGRTLERAGASWDDVVDLSSFHTDVAGQIGIMAGVHKRYVKAPYPAWTAVGVSKLLGDGITEIKITAKRPQRARAAN